jgi:hypothetical protein
MFGFNKKDTTSDNDMMVKAYKDCENKQKQYWAWLGSEEGKRIYHLQTLIMKTYETVNIEAEIYGRRLGEIYTSEDYLNDFQVFFKPEVFNKLKEWCKEYETLCKAEEKVISEL